MERSDAKIRDDVCFESSWVPRRLLTLQSTRGGGELRLMWHAKEAAVNALWLAICDIEDKRARERAKERWRPATERRAAGRLVEGQITTNWKQAHEQLALAYPDRINPHL